MTHDRPIDNCWSPRFCKTKNNNQKYKTLVEASTEGLIMLIDGKIGFLNNAIGKITGFENTELINHKLNEIIAENDSPFIYEKIGNFYKN